MKYRGALPLLFLLLAACGKQAASPQSARAYEDATVARRTLSIEVEAAGVIEPIQTVELKSKASGEILEIAADTGDTVQRGALLVRIDQRTPRNRLGQAVAQLNAAKSRRVNAQSQLERAGKLLANQWINQADYDNLVMAVANAEADVVTQTVAVENARIALEDTEVRAPGAGTILTRRVEPGQVISSPTTDVGGGTLLLTMADLSDVRVRARVDETDIGKVAPGMRADVTVASYPGRRFIGTIEKIEPQAIVEQNVTLFPVLISLPNQERLLRPGMNVDVKLAVSRREQVLSIPVTALRTERDVTTTAKLLGLDEATLRATVAGAAPAGAAAVDGKRAGGTTGAMRLGGDFWVVADRQGAYVPVPIKTGMTDLDQVEVTQGLAEGDKVLVLPSSSLVEAQERLQSFVSSRGGIPGMTQKSPDTAAAPAPAGGRRQRKER
jgi:HlyD family secretion protein